MAQTVHIYPISNYTFEEKDPKLEKNYSIHTHLRRIKLKYEQEGMRTTVEGIIMVHERNHSHVLLLLAGNAFYKLPGGRLRPGENEIDGLKRKLTTYFGHTSQDLACDWKIGECVAVWWRPNFETSMYPYCPPHITKPKECIKLFLVHLAKREYFQVPKNFRLVAIPLFELYDNENYGQVSANIPQSLSRFEFKMSTDH